MAGVLYDEEYVPQEPDYLYCPYEWEGEDPTQCDANVPSVSYLVEAVKKSFTEGNHDMLISCESYHAECCEGPLMNKGLTLSTYFMSYPGISLPAFGGGVIHVTSARVCMQAFYAVTPGRCSCSCGTQFIYRAKGGTGLTFDATNTISSAFKFEDGKVKWLTEDLGLALLAGCFLKYVPIPHEIEIKIERKVEPVSALDFWEPEGLISDVHFVHPQERALAPEPPMDVEMVRLVRTELFEHFNPTLLLNARSDFSGEKLKEVELPRAQSEPLVPRVCLPRGDDALIDQFFIDKAPEHFNREPATDQWQVESDDFTVDFPTQVRLRERDEDWFRRKPDFAVSSIRTGLEMPRIATKKEMLMAFSKRNVGAPQMVEVPQEIHVKRLADRFFRTFLKEGGWDKGDGHYWDDFFHRKGRKVFSLENCYDDPLSSYLVMLKSAGKFSLDLNFPVRSVPQTITYHEKWVTEVFSPMFLQVMARFFSRLQDWVVVPAGPMADFSRVWPSFEGKCLTEIDLSKFDKSQGKLLHDVQREIFLRLGFPPIWCDWWFKFHESSYLNDKNLGIAFSVDYQRRTGNTATYFGNTLVTMIMMAEVYELDSLPFCGLFSGDDNLIVTDRPLEGRVSLFPNMFNMEAKVMRPGQNYMCSKYLCTVDGRVTPVPDPFKLLKKAGASCPLEHLDDFYESFLDYTKYLVRDEVRTLIPRLMAHRYQVSMDEAGVALDQIMSWRKSKTQFFKHFQYRKPIKDSLEAVKSDFLSAFGKVDDRIRVWRGRRTNHKKEVDALKVPLVSFRE
ncbi:2a protein [Olive latent virus 2]|uniref:RNA-directed RNA polymerase 2a n=1 Tax=Olive latent virus 2 (isolate Italy) TaxID=650489 RepID=RDRP_OLV2I|nr:2a protein [Olive latent virus 2]Q83944.1 RecName: Full=RNA-directed RNA polymerase 2a; Short=protein 2a [Olive latent virus 2 isolate Italy]CAA64073.1 2a protein [Olive latent virus 2]